MSLVRRGEKHPMWGKKHTKESIEKMRKARLGLKFSLESRKRCSNAKKGDKHPNWRGGITPINQRIRYSFEMKLWRKAVFERDKYTCIWCGDKKGGNLNADHIKPFALYPELRFAIDNGRTLCVNCHKTTETYGGNTKDLSTLI